MDKEELLRKFRFWSGLVTGAFVVLIVALVVQFGFIAHRNNEIARLREANAAKRAQLAEQSREQAFDDAYYEQLLLEHGYRAR